MRYKSTPNKLPNVFNKEQLIKIFDAIDLPRTLIGCSLGFFCGLRITEVVSLLVRNIDLEKRVIKIENGKGEKDGYVDIPPMIIPILKKWLDLLGPDSKWMFPSPEKKGWHIGKSCLFRNYINALKKAGLRTIEKEIRYKIKGTSKEYYQPRYRYYFHTLRHTYATYLLEQGVDIVTISKLMRHNQLETTMIYLHISNTMRKSAVDDAFDPYKKYDVVNSNFRSKTKEENEQTKDNYTSQSKPIDILKMKLVNGDITCEEFEMKVKLINPSLSFNTDKANLRNNIVESITNFEKPIMDGEY